jgi:hypoxanthine phosphoribosyltransferase
VPRQGGIRSGLEGDIDKSPARQSGDADACLFDVLVCWDILSAAAARSGGRHHCRCPADNYEQLKTEWEMTEGMRCELISWERFYGLARELALSIRRAGLRPDLIVAIGRGGYMPARIISDYLDIYDLTDIRIQHYHGAHMERLARVRYPLAADINGKRVLLVDDVSDSGGTFETAIRHLREHGEPEQLVTAVLHHKRVSSYKADFYAEEVGEWHWITYPWALLEDLRSFLHDMDPAPATAEEFAHQLNVRHGIEVGQQTLHDVFTMFLA